MVKISSSEDLKLKIKCAVLQSDFIPYQNIFALSEHIFLSLKWKRSGKFFIKRKHADHRSFLTLATYLSPVDPQREFNSRPATGYVPVEFWKKTGMCLSPYRLHVLTDLCQSAAHI